MQRDRGETPCRFKCSKISYQQSSSTILIKFPWRAPVGCKQCKYMDHRGESGLLAAVWEAQPRQSWAFCTLWYGGSVKVPAKKYEHSNITVLFTWHQIKRIKVAAAAAASTLDQRLSLSVTVSSLQLFLIRHANTHVPNVQVKTVSHTHKLWVDFGSLGLFLQTIWLVKLAAKCKVTRLYV